MPSFAMPDLSGRIAVVTGASGGIGLWTAVGLAKAGAEVALCCRDTAKGNRATAFVAEQARCPRPRVFLADFSSLKAVARLGEELAEAYPLLHILVNNAGLVSPSWQPSADGYELTFAVNHLAPFLLTRQLLPSLRRAGRESGRNARVVTVASIMAQNAFMKFADLMRKRNYSLAGAYAQSKLANIMFTKELARRLHGEGVTANCLHPGLVATNIGSKGVFVRLGWAFLRPFSLSAEKGAENSLYVASAPELENATGAFFVRMKPVAPNPQAEDPTLTARLWQESEDLIAAALARQNAK